jgi:putative hydrolase of the HAD superfamily
VHQFSHLLLDLDDTLYPNDSGVWEAVRDRIQTYIETRLSISGLEAQSLRERYLEQFGTTLSGLSEEFGVDVEEYLDYVHDVPLDQLLGPDPALHSMLESIKIPRVIFTNAYGTYVERVLDRLGIQDQIDQVIDIYALDFQNKPRKEAYHVALNLITAEDPSGVVFVDDRLANLEPAAELDMTTVLVGPARAGNEHLQIDRIYELTRVLPQLMNETSEDHSD